MSAAGIGVDELAAMVLHGRDWVRAQCRAGLLPHHRAGRKYVFTESDVADILARMAVPTRAQSVPAARPRGRLIYSPIGESGHRSADDRVAYGGGGRAAEVDR